MRLGQPSEERFPRKKINPLESAALFQGSQHWYLLAPLLEPLHMNLQMRFWNLGLLRLRQFHIVLLPNRLEHVSARHRFLLPDRALPRRQRLAVQLDRHRLDVRLRCRFIQSGISDDKRNVVPRLEVRPGRRKHNIESKRWPSRSIRQQFGMKPRWLLFRPKSWTPRRTPHLSRRDKSFAYRARLHVWATRIPLGGWICCSTITMVCSCS